MTDLASLYRLRFSNTGLEKRNRVWRILCSHYFSRYITPDATVLDIACGYGEFINNISAAKKYAVDLNPDAAGGLAKDVSFVNTKADDLSHLADNSIDVAFTSNFLEHLPSKSVCDDLFREVRRVLRPGGQFIIMGPNIRYAYREYWDYYDHHLPLSHVSLAEGLSVAGFGVRTVIDRFLPYTMNNSKPTYDFLIRSYLALPLFWRFFGKQFLVVGVKE